MKTYRVVLTDQQDGPVDHTQSREVIAENHRAAGLLAFQIAPFDCAARRAFRSGFHAFAWVWDDESPKHPNGAPIIVHGLSLTRGGAS